MRSLRVPFCVMVVLCVVVGVSTAAVEDDDYEDDPEHYPARIKAAMEMLQQELSLTSTPTPPPKTPKAPVQKQRSKWLYARDTHGYLVLSDGPKIETELIKAPQMVRIRVHLPGTARHVERSFEWRQAQLKIRQWNRVHKVQVKVPFGMDSERDLRIVERKDHIDILAPVADRNLFTPYKRI